MIPYRILLRAAWPERGSAVLRVMAVAATLLLTGAAQSDAQQPAGVADDVIRGTVSSANRPEAGVRVIAETTELPTKLVKIVVSDDRGRLWSTYAGRAPYHIEGGKGTTSKVAKFQLRPDPLAP